MTVTLVYKKFLSQRTGPTWHVILPERYPVRWPTACNGLAFTPWHDRRLRATPGEIRAGFVRNICRDCIPNQEEFRP